VIKKAHFLARSSSRPRYTVDPVLNQGSDPSDPISGEIPGEGDFRRRFHQRCGAGAAVESELKRLFAKALCHVDFRRCSIEVVVNSSIVM